MAIGTIADYGEPDPERGEPAAQGQARVRAGAGLQAHAPAAIMRLLQDDPTIARETQGMIRTRIYVEELTRRSDKARESAANAEQAAEKARAAELQGTEMLARHVGSIHHMLFPRALSSAVPEVVDHARWTAAALRQAIHTVFPAPLPAVADRDWSLAAASEPQDAGPAQLEDAHPGS